MPASKDAQNQLINRKRWPSSSARRSVAAAASVNERVEMGKRKYRIVLLQTEQNNKNNHSARERQRRRKSVYFLLENKNKMRRQK